MKITIGFSRAKSPYAIGSKFIQLVEKRPFSHVYIRHEHPLTKVQLVTQASHGLVHQTSFRLFQEKNIVVKEYAFELDSESIKDYLTFLQENLGKPYSQLQLFWIGVKKLLHIKVKAHNDYSAYICSELVARTLKAIKIVNTSNEDYITPSDLEKLINKL